MLNNFNDLKQIQTSCKRVVLIGPESTGKTTLAKELAKQFDTAWVSEYLREFAQNKLKSQDKEIRITDNYTIVQNQLNLENEALKKANKVLICDTNFLETMFYSHLYFGEVSDFFEFCLKNLKYDLYLLTNIDIVWQPDDVRDKPFDRKKHYDYFKNRIIDLNLPFVKIFGDRVQREQKAVLAIKELLKD